MSVVVAILAGGAGSRIGGDKPGRLLNGLPLLDHALRAARTTDAPLILVVRRPEQAAGFEGKVVIDAPGIDGPLAGLLSALNWAENAGADRVLTLPCDMPFLPGDLHRRLDHALTTDVGVAVAASAGQLHPVCALWRTGAAQTLVQRAGAGRLSLHGLSEAVGLIPVDWAVEGGDPFININTAADLAAAETSLR